MTGPAKRHPQGAGETNATDVVVYCSVDERGGPVSITLVASTALASRCTFGLWDETGETQLETWKLTAGSSGRDEYSIGVLAETLDGSCLYWSIEICAVNPAIRTGFVQIQATQDGVACTVTENLRWSLHDVPPCSISGDSGITIQRSLTFRNA